MISRGCAPAKGLYHQSCLLGQLVSVSIVLEEGIEASHLSWFAMMEIKVKRTWYIVACVSSSNGGCRGTSCVGLVKGPACSKN